MAYMTINYSWLGMKTEFQVDYKVLRDFIKILKKCKTSMVTPHQMNERRKKCLLRFINHLIRRFKE